MSWMREVVGKRPLVFHLDRHEKLEVERCDAIVVRAQSETTSDLVAANRGNVGERVLQRLPDRRPFRLAKIGPRREEHKMDDQRRTFLTRRVPSLRRVSLRSSFGGSAVGFGSVGRGGAGLRSPNRPCDPNGFLLPNGFRAPNGLRSPGGFRSLDHGLRSPDGF